MKKLLVFSILLISCLSHAQQYVLYGLLPNNTIFSYNINTSTYSVCATLNGTNGATPITSFILANDGLLYGTASGGGAHNDGTIFSFNPATNAVTDVHDFKGGIDGQEPWGKAIQAKNGLLYSMTEQAGKYGNGTIYSYNISTGKDSTLLSFTNYYAGGEMEGNLIEDTITSGGLLYGMSEFGGTRAYGLFFSFDSKTNTDSARILFNDTNGFMPEGSVMQAKDGYIYGLATTTLFRYDPRTNKDTVLITFNIDSIYFPYYTVMLEARDSLLYGMSVYGGHGGSNGFGTIFSYNRKTGRDSVLYRFDSIHGKNPYGSLIEDTVNGLFYGMTTYGGANNGGVIFSFDPKTDSLKVLHDFVAYGEPYGDLLLLKMYPTSITAPSNNQVGLNIYPNPASDNVQLSYILDKASVTTIQIIDLLGSVVYAENKGQQQAGAVNENISTSGLATGTYMVKLTTNNITSIKKLVIIR